MLEHKIEEIEYESGGVSWKEKVNHYRVLGIGVNRSPRYQYDLLLYSHVFRGLI